MRSPAAGPRDPAEGATGRGRALHAFAVAVAACAFAPLLLGGLVTSRKAGLSVPDWPTSLGAWLFPPDWTRTPNVFEEHLHRLAAAAVGALVVALAIWIHRSEPRAWVRRLGWTALGLVVLQGVLGGLFRVVLLQDRAAPVHGILGQAFFCLMVATALFLSRGWREAPPPESLPAAGRIRRATLVAAAAVFLQVVVGAVFRHWDKILRDPPAEHFTVLVGIHAATGLAATLLGLRAMVATFQGAPGRPALSGPAMLVGFGLVAQVVLGLVAWLARVKGIAEEVVPPPYQFWTATAHQAAGAIVLAASLVLALRARHLLADPGAGDSFPAPAAAAPGGGAA
jgi:cytochrome c oxidase assembly protein subunit 15